MSQKQELLAKLDAATAAEKEARLAVDTVANELENERSKALRSGGCVGWGRVGELVAGGAAAVDAVNRRAAEVSKLRALIKEEEATLKQREAEEAALKQQEEAALKQREEAALKQQVAELKQQFAALNQQVAALKQQQEEAAAQQHRHFILTCLCWGLLLGWLSWVLAAGSSPVKVDL